LVSELALTITGSELACEQQVKKNVWFYGMGGLSTWGLRATGGLTYFLKESGLGSSFSLGYSYSTGMDELETPL
jgi:hypothetical protein